MELILDMVKVGIFKGIADTITSYCVVGKSILCQSLYCPQVSNSGAC